MNRLLTAIFARQRTAGRATAANGPWSPTGSGRDSPSPLRVYLAGRFARREELRAVASELEQLGFEVTSRWLFEDAAIPGGVLVADGRAAQIACMDFADVHSADVCIAFTEPPDSPQGRGGRHTELGIALALGQRVMIVGPREHVFHCLPALECYESWPDARDHVHAEHQPRRRELAPA